jgi:hypothetical protein
MNFRGKFLTSKFIYEKEKYDTPVVMFYLLGQLYLSIIASEYIESFAAPVVLNCSRLYHVSNKAGRMFRKPLYQYLPHWQKYKTKEPGICPAL